MFSFFKKKQAPANVPEIIPIQEEGGISIAKCWTGKEDADIVVNMTDASKHQNSVISIVGSHGQGKDFTGKLILYRLCKQGAQATILTDGLSREEYGYMCDQLGGKNVIIGEENSHINLFDIRKPKEGSRKCSVLTRKVQELLTVFRAMYPEMTPEQAGLLDALLYRLYKVKGITYDNASLLVEDSDQYKEFPTIEDFYTTIKLAHLKELDDFTNVLSQFVDGPYGWFNHKTDVDWDSPFLVLDFMKYRGQIEKDSTAKDFMMAYCFEILSERMQDEADKKAILMRDVFFGENRDVMKNAPFMLERDTTLSWSKHLCQNAMPCDCTVITVTSVFNDGIDDAFLHEIMADSDVQVYHKIFSHLVPNVAKACHLSEKNAKYVSELQRGHVIIFADGKWTWSDVKADDEEYKMMTEYPSDIRVYGRDWQ